MAKRKPNIVVNAREPLVQGNKRPTVVAKTREHPTVESMQNHRYFHYYIFASGRAIAGVHPIEIKYLECFSPEEQAEFLGQCEKKVQISLTYEKQLRYRMTCDALRLLLTRRNKSTPKTDTMDQFENIDYLHMVGWHKFFSTDPANPNLGMASDEELKRDPSQVSWHKFFPTDPAISNLAATSDEELMRLANLYKSSADATEKKLDLFRPPSVGNDVPSEGQLGREVFISAFGNRNKAKGSHSKGLSTSFRNGPDSLTPVRGLTYEPVRGDELHFQPNLNDPEHPGRPMNPYGDKVTAQPSSMHPRTESGVSTNPTNTKLDNSHNADGLATVVKKIGERRETLSPGPTTKQRVKSPSGLPGTTLRDSELPRSSGSVPDVTAGPSKEGKHPIAPATNADPDENGTLHHGKVVIDTPYGRVVIDTDAATHEARSDQTSANNDVESTEKKAPGQPDDTRPEFTIFVVGGLVPWHKITVKIPRKVDETPADRTMQELLKYGLHVWSTLADIFVGAALICLGNPDWGVPAYVYYAGFVFLCGYWVALSYLWDYCIRPRDINQAPVQRGLMRTVILGLAVITVAVCAAFVLARHFGIIEFTTPTVPANFTSSAAEQFGDETTTALPTEVTPAIPAIDSSSTPGLNFTAGPNVATESTVGPNLEMNSTSDCPAVFNSTAVHNSVAGYNSPLLPPPVVGSLVGFAIGSALLYHFWTQLPNAAMAY